MALTKLNTTWVNGSYQNDRDAYIKSEENQLLAGGKLRYLAPYYDGSIAVGYGFDLVVHSDAEINKAFADAGLSITLGDADKNLLAAARAYRAASRAKPPTISSVDLQTTLTYISDQLKLNLGSEPNAVKLLDSYMVKQAEPQVTAFLKKWNGADWESCRERVALISLAYNGGPGLLTTKIGEAIASGNRAEAWFEIRYDLNKNGSYTNRRYREADVFGLYDNPTAPTLDESKQIYRMFTQHRDVILNYENQYSPSGVTDPLTGAGVGTIRDNLGFACATLLGDLASNTNADIANAYSAWLAAGNDPSTFDPTKMFVGDPARGVAVDARQYSMPGVMGTEIASNDIVMAGEGGVFGTTGYARSGVWSCNNAFTF